MLLAGMAAVSPLMMQAAPVPKQGKAEPPEVVYYADAYADHYHVQKELVHALIWQESGWNPHAISSKGAMGLMQLMPTTAREYGVERPFMIEDNLSGGVRYLASLIRRYKGDLRLAVAAYYCGQHALDMQGLSYSNPEVVRYVESVRSRYLKEIAKEQKINEEPEN